MMSHKVNADYCQTLLISDNVAFVFLKEEGGFLHLLLSLNKHPLCYLLN